MKQLIFTLCMLFSLAVSAQLFSPPGNVPRSYWSELDRTDKQDTRETARFLKQYKQANKDRFDFFLTPVPVPVAETAINNGAAWYYDYLEIPQNEAKIKALATGKFHMDILDTGEPDFEGLTEWAYPGQQPISYTGEPVKDGHSHSTHISGTYVYKTSQNSFGPLSELKGRFFLNWRKVCTNGGGCSHTWIVKAVRESIAFYNTELKPKGIKGGITMSLGGGSPSQQVISAVQDALNAGMFVFASSGNNGREDISFPAEIEGVVALGAHDQRGQKAGFSNWAKPGEKLFGVGPGVSILSTCKGDQFCVMSGTSMGNPLFNQAVAMVAMCKPDWNVQKTLDYVANNCKDLGAPGFDNRMGYGTPVVTKLLDNLGDTPPPPPSCNDGLRNGDEKGVDCGGSCPPCDTPPPPPSDDVFPNRTIPVVLEGAWPVRWHVVNSQAVDFSSYATFELDGLLGYTQEGTPFVSNIALSLDNWAELTINKIELRVKSTKDASITAQQMESLMDKMWSNRGLGLAYPADFSVAGQYAAFFTDLLADRLYGNFELTVGSITFTNQFGSTLTYSSSELPQWPRNSNPFYVIPDGYDMSIHVPNQVQYKTDTTATVQAEKYQWEVTAIWSTKNSVKLEPKYSPAVDFEFDDYIGVHKTLIWSHRRPSRTLIEASKPYGQNWKLESILKTIRLPRK